MATRYAGDFFGVPLAGDEPTESQLFKYYPELREVSKAKEKTAYETFKEDLARYSSPKTPEAFGGFREFEKKPAKVATAPAFGGVPSFDVNY